MVILYFLSVLSLSYLIGKIRSVVNDILISNYRLIDNCFNYILKSSSSKYNNATIQRKIY